MKRFMRKGFTLIELLVVLTVIGILSATFTMSGREVSNIARANKIVEDFQIISTAMNMYYSHNTDACEDGTMTAAKILTGLKGYLKSTTYIEASGEEGYTAATGKFGITIHTDDSWWLTYTLPASSVQIGRILANRAAQEEFVTSVGGTTDYTIGGNDDATTVTNVSVCYKVR